MSDDQTTQGSGSDDSAVPAKPVRIAPIKDPNNIEINYDENNKPMRPDFDAVADQEQRIKWKQAYLNALNKYIADKKAQIAEFEKKIRLEEEQKEKQQEEQEIANLDDMLQAV